MMAGWLPVPREVRQMLHDRSRDRFLHIDGLIVAQRKEVAAALSDPPEGAASLAATGFGVDGRWRAPLCAGAVSRGKARDLRLSLQGVWEDPGCAHAQGSLASCHGKRDEFVLIFWARQGIRLGSTNPRRWLSAEFDEMEPPRIAVQVPPASRPWLGRGHGLSPGTVCAGCALARPGASRILATFPVRHSR